MIKKVLRRCLINSSEDFSVNTQESFQMKSGHIGDIPVETWHRSSAQCRAIPDQKFVPEMWSLLPACSSWHLQMYELERRATKKELVRW